MRIPRWIVLALTSCLALLNIAQAQTPLRLVTLEYPPYINNVDGTPRGPIVDVVTEAFKRSGRQVAITFYPWSRGLSMVQGGQADGLFTIKKSQERENALLYPKEPLLSQDYVFFIRNGSEITFTGDYASIATARIGLVRNTSYGTRFDDAFKQGVFRNIETATDYNHIFLMLLAGRIDAVICSRLVGLSYLRELKAENHAHVSGPPSETAYSYLVFTRKIDYTALAQTFDHSLASMKKDGTLNSLFAPIH